VADLAGGAKVDTTWGKVGVVVLVEAAGRVNETAAELLVAWLGLTEWKQTTQALSVTVVCPER